MRKEGYGDVHVHGLYLVVLDWLYDSSCFTMHDVVMSIRIHDVLTITVVQPCIQVRR